MINHIIAVVYCERINREGGSQWKESKNLKTRPVTWRDMFGSESSGRWAESLERWWQEPVGDKVERYEDV